MKLKVISFLLLFLSSILFATFIVNKYDKYEISTDSKSNHTMIKGDVNKYWKGASFIKKQSEEGIPFYKSGKSYYQAFLPPKLISAFYIFISDDMFLNEIIDDAKFKVKSNNSKNYFFYIQILIFYISILVLLKSLKKNNLEISTICIFFLILEPTINQFHYSFYTESIFLSLLILVLSQIINNSNNKINAFLIGFIIGVMYLQRSVAILYFLPVLFFFLLERKNIKFYLSYFFGFLLVISFIGFHNYQRAGLIYFTPYQSKQDFFLYLIPNVEKEKNTKQNELEIDIIKDKMIKFKSDNNLNLSLEKDLLTYGTHLRNLSISYLLENPIPTVKVMIKKSIHASLLNPFEVYSFYEYEYKPANPKFRYYKNEEHKRNLKIRIIYSVIFYTICAVGVYSMLRKKKNINLIIFLITSCLYFISIAGWVGNPRYLSPNIIFLSIFFSYGLVEIKQKIFFRS